MELSTADAAILGVAEQTIRNHIDAGRLPARRHGIRGIFRINGEDPRTFAQRYNYPFNEESALLN